MRKKLLAIPIILMVVVVAAVGIYFMTIPGIYISPNRVAVLSGHQPSPENFIAFYRDNDYITAEILSPPYSAWHQSGDFEVILELSYGRRTVQKDTVAYVLVPNTYIEVEVGTPVDSIHPRAFLRGADAVPGNALFETQIITPLTGFTDATGQHTVEIYLNDASFFSTLRIIDTTPPTATPVNATVPMGTDILASSFITDLFDHSLPVTVQFAGDGPDVFLAGEQAVDMLLTDRYGNSAIYTAVLTVLPNTMPPRIIGARDIQLVLDSSAMFRLGVSAYDAFGRPIDFTVDSSGVDVDTLGVYYLTYRAEDCCGNYTEITVRIYVVDVDPEEVQARAAVVLDRILRDDMTQVDQARAIFNWVTANVGYAAGFEHRTVYESANQALVHRRGDCFVFYAISELLLTMAGIPNMRIDRYGGNNRHVWNLINPDDLGWHHFDTTPLIVRQLDRFMFTQSQAEAFTRIIHAEGQGRDYFTFNPELYPEIVR